MIWHETDPTVRHVEGCLRAHRGAADLAADELREIAVAVSSFCGDALTRRGLPSGMLDLYIARALWGAGRDDRAYQHLSAAVEDHEEREALWDLLTLKDAHPILWPAVIRGLIRFSRWTAAGGDRIWMIDLDRLAPDPVLVELSLYGALKQLISALAPLWASTGGHGALGIRESRCLRPGRRHRSIIGFCEDVLAGLAGQQGWDETPRILRVDIRGR